MKKFLLQVVMLLLAAFAGLMYVYRPQALNFLPLTNTQSQNNPIPSVSKAKVGEVTLDIEVADSPQERSQGLGGRESLAENSGMLFIFDKPGKYKFWMKGVSFPLDFIWIRNAKVVDIIKNVPGSNNLADDQLPIYEPITEVDQVLEVGSGYVDKNGIKVGDSVILIQE